MRDISAEAAAPTDRFLSFRTAEAGGKGRADAPQPGGLPAMELRVSTIGRRLRPPVFVRELTEVTGERRPNAPMCVGPRCRRRLSRTAFGML